MSDLLWRFYLEDNVDKFKTLLSSGHHISHNSSKGHGPGSVYSGGLGVIGSPGSGYGTSPRNTVKSRKSSGHAGNTAGSKGQSSAFSRAELNSRDQSGLTILHRAASSIGGNSLEFATALIEHPNIDLYTQDRENGWTALHRALYFGNITIARALMERETKDSIGQGASNALLRLNALIKVKDFEGNSPFDVYNATIARRTLSHRNYSTEDNSADEADEDSTEADDGVVTTALSDSVDNDSVDSGDRVVTTTSNYSIDGDEVFAFGSNKNLTLGFGDQDDRQHPEKVLLKRPDHLLYRFYQEHLISTAADPSSVDSLQILSLKAVSDLPAIIRNRPIVIQDVCLSKLHSAILTTDPESNLFMCGFGPGGRLGTGDETTRFSYACIEGGGLAGKKVIATALGLNHSMAVSSEGEIFTWGVNTWGQLGYTLPPAPRKEEPFVTTPRQVFGALKRERVVGVAASAIHSVAYTTTSLYTWGKNDGQLGLMDSNSRSLEAQPAPRRITFSLLTSAIQMVSAIERATICLLANHTVIVFANYGYTNVKFPVHDGFSNFHLSNSTLSTRYETDPSHHISQITSGGDTIAAISSRGDLFTFNVSQKLDSNPAATSTTNPAKIKNALSPPKRIWALRKGHWDGVKSVGVSQDGSVIICTQAGAVWRRVKRPKVKHAFTSGTGEFKIKDYKFQRVPGLTKVAAVRSNIFGGYAAIRKDCDVTKTQIVVEEQSLWKDIAPLFSLQKLEFSEAPEIEESGSPRFWVPSIPKEHFSPFKRAVLLSPDLESDVSCCIRDAVFDDEEYDFTIRTSLSDTCIPVNGFLLAARSPVLREALHEYRRDGTYNLPDCLEISQDTNSTRPSIVFHGLDFITVLNLVLYTYTDEVVDVWHFPRHSPDRAFRYRQIRIELMKLAAKLGMTNLELAVRLMSEPERRLNIDLALAFEDPRFFENGDAIAELEGGEMRVHSILLRQRCPFFEGLFNGRAGGGWLAERRKTAKDTMVDLKHIDPSTFELVLRYLYADVGTELFDKVVSADVDEFCDIVMDVLSVANELMLDRLSEICQKVLGRFVNTRTACQLLNAVGPCAVTEFKDAGLEYLCLQLEAMLENQWLEELDDEYMLELDEVVRENQLACLPFSKSGRAELLLHERHPSLAGEIDEERQRLVRDMAFRSSIKDEDSRVSLSFRARVGSVDDMSTSSPSQEKSSKRVKSLRNAPFSPSIRPKDSTADLMFDMDEDEGQSLDNINLPRQRPGNNYPLDPTSGVAASMLKKETQHSNDKIMSLEEGSPLQSPKILPLATPPSFPDPRFATPGTYRRPSVPAVKPWSSPVLSPSTAKLDMREIMAQASSGRTSALSASLSAQKVKDDALKPTTPKMSQKERKKLQQQALQQSIAEPLFTLDAASPGNNTPSPWRIVSPGPKISEKSILEMDARKQTPGQPAQLPNSPVASLSLNRRRTASPDTRFSGQERITSITPVPKNKQTASSSMLHPRSSSQPQPSKLSSLVPHSKSYSTRPAQAEPSIQLSMDDIIGQQRREQDIIKEAVAKRSLQEIQEEQAFQEWWDQESRRAQEEEATRVRNSAAASNTSAGGRGKSGKRGRPGVLRGRGDGAGIARGRGRG